MLSVVVAIVMAILTCHEGGGDGDSDIDNGDDDNDEGGGNCASQEQTIHWSPLF